MNCRCFGLVLIPIVFWTNFAPADDTREQFFESKIRPLLTDRCLPCHGVDKPDAGLSLESKDGWSDRHVIKPGSPDESLLIKAVRYQDDDLQMPPADSGYPKLSDAEIRWLEKWISDGAVDPRQAVGSTGPKRRAREFQLTEQDLKHWAYQPLQRPLQNSPQSVAGATSNQACSLQIDSLIEQKLKDSGLASNPRATPRELVRRAFFDLWGLPPKPEDVACFEANPSAEQWQILVDHLLSSHHYGERWGRYWLDWVRFAETNGYERDGVKPDAWRYRDYVISAFNTNKPFDRFIAEQLAGDLLIQVEHLNPTDHTLAWQECIIATGYYRLHVWDDEPDSTDAAEMDDLDDIIVTTGASMLGLTIGCARCHDHKFDPLSQSDYYSLLDLFRDIDPYGQSKKGGGGRGTGRIDRYLVDAAQVEAWKAEQNQKIQHAEKQLAGAAEDAKQPLNDRLKELKQATPPFAKALAINEPSAGRKPTHVLIRGDYHTPAALATPAIPLLFRTLAENVSALRDTDRASVAAASVEQNMTPADFRTRLDLANWITNKAHPLTARVLVNRVWQKHFGAGIVPTTDDFGFTGLPSSNPELLDYLASFTLNSNWSIKDLHRAIMLSATYQRSSAVKGLATGGHTESRNPDLENQAARDATSDVEQVDAENRLNWRQNLRRLDAEAIRDSMLSYAGVLQDKCNGPSVYSTLSAEIRETANPVSLSTWGSNTEAEQNCRSVFLMVKRSLKDPILESFDFANSHSPVGQRAVTTVAPQALMMLNDNFMQRQATALAVRVLEADQDASKRAEHLWQIVLQRSPTSREYVAVRTYLDSKDSSLTQLEIWTGLCRALLNSNEAIYID